MLIKFVIKNRFLQKNLFLLKKTNLRLVGIFAMKRQSKTTIKYYVIAQFFLLNNYRLWKPNHLNLMDNFF